jgi:hypothetical protein
VTERKREENSEKVRKVEDEAEGLLDCARRGGRGYAEAVAEADSESRKEGEGEAGRKWERRRKHTPRKNELKRVLTGPIRSARKPLKICCICHESVRMEKRYEDKQEDALVRNR